MTESTFKEEKSSLMGLAFGSSCNSTNAHVNMSNCFNNVLIQDVERKKGVIDLNKIGEKYTN